LQNEENRQHELSYHFSVPPVLTVTLIFCPGFKLLIPNFADEPEGFGTILIGALLFSGFVFEVATGFGLLLALLVGRAGVITVPSFTVTLIFWPGFKFSRPTFALDPEVFGLIASFLEEVGEGLALGDTFEVGVAEGFGVAFGDAFGDGEAVGFDVGVTVGFGDGVGVAEGEGVADGVGVGVTDGDGDGDGVGVGVGVTIVGEGALGAVGGEGTK
jgi:hypothetical protein